MLRSSGKWEKDRLKDEDVTQYRSSMGHSKAGFFRNWVEEGFCYKQSRMGVSSFGASCVDATTVSQHNLPLSSQSPEFVYAYRNPKSLKPPAIQSPS